MLRRMRSGGNKENDHHVGGCAPPSATPADCVQLSGEAGSAFRGRSLKSDAHTTDPLPNNLHSELAVLQSAEFASFLRGVAAQVWKRAAHMYHLT